MEKIKGLFGIIWRAKLKIIATLVLTGVFIVVLFPLNDINDFVTSEVAKQTGNQVYVQFDNINLSLIPSPGLALDALSLQAGPMPPLSIRRLEVHPSLMGLLLQKIDARASAQGLFRGQVEATIKPGKKYENGAIAQAITLKAERVNLADLRQFASLPVSIRGQVNLNADGVLDMAFTNQPDVTVDLQSPSFELEPSTIDTMMGPLSLPALKMGRLQIKGRLSAGQFVIEDGVFGKEGDEVAGSIKGKMGLEMRNLGGRILPVPSTYEFQVDLAAKKSFEDRSKLFLMLIEQHRKPEGENGRYRFVVTGNAMTQQFNFSPAR